MSNSKAFKVAIVWRGDAQVRAEARGETSRLKAIFEALEQQGITAEPAVWSEEFTDAVREQLLGADGVLVWVDPISTATGQRRGSWTVCYARWPPPAPPSAPIRT